VPDVREHLVADADPPAAADVRWSRALPPSLLPLEIEDDDA
jgi:hypothetical protein